MRKTGIVLSLLGIALGALAVMFAAGYQPAQGFLGSLPAMEVVLRPGHAVELADEPVTGRGSFYQWEDAAGKAQTADHPPALGTEVRAFRVAAHAGNRWGDRPGRVRTEVRGRRTLPLRAVLAGAVILLLTGLGTALLARGR
ncbi:MAG TPA: hypothetical protein VF768_08570 [Holophagaceae bacterium]